MILGAHQLHYLPWLRYFHKIALCDTFVVLDNIQFNKNGWQNRNKIRTPKGWSYLSVPVLQRNEQLISEVQIDNHQSWRRKHWGSLSGFYAKAPYFKDHAGFLCKIYETPWEKLNDLNYEMFFYFLKTLGIKTKIIRSSDMNLRGEATDRLVGICKDLGAKSYLTGAYAAEVYLDSAFFEREGISLVFQKFDCPVYPQLYPEAGFVPELSIIDLLMNCGPRSLEVLMSSSGVSDK